MGGHCLLPALLCSMLPGGWPGFMHALALQLTVMHLGEGSSLDHREFAKRPKGGDAHRFWPSRQSLISAHSSNASAPEAHLGMQEMLGSGPEKVQACSRVFSLWLLSRSLHTGWAWTLLMTQPGTKSMRQYKM